ncbi:uncharacterized protein V1518DRAFT_410310 [Limtongia smithiae]|uniref:uncharacterized protein n=1 Tax=Limtongia smithiae TaxID=1125753 RepID=UPI0034CE381D
MRAPKTCFVPFALHEEQRNEDVKHAGAAIEIEKRSNLFDSLLVPLLYIGRLIALAYAKLIRRGSTQKNGDVIDEEKAADTATQTGTDITSVDQHLENTQVTICHTKKEVLQDNDMNNQVECGSEGRLSRSPPGDADADRTTEVTTTLANKTDSGPADAEAVDADIGATASADQIEFTTVNASDDGITTTAIEERGAGTKSHSDVQLAAANTTAGLIGAIKENCGDNTTALSNTAVEVISTSTESSSDTIEDLISECDATIEREITAVPSSVFSLAASATVLDGEGCTREHTIEGMLANAGTEKLEVKCDNGETKEDVDSWMNTVVVLDLTATNSDKNAPVVATAGHDAAVTDDLLEVSPTESGDSRSTEITEYDAEYDADNEDTSMRAELIVVPRDCLSNRSWFSDNEDDEWLGICDDEQLSDSDGDTTECDIVIDGESTTESATKEIRKQVTASSRSQDQFTASARPTDFTGALWMNDSTREEIMSEEYFMVHGHYLPPGEPMEYLPDRAFTKQGWLECTFGPWAPHDHYRAEIDGYLRMLPPRLFQVLLADLNNTYMFPTAHTTTTTEHADKLPPHLAAGNKGCQTCFFMWEYVRSVYERYQALVCEENWRMLDCGHGHRHGTAGRRAWRYEYSGHVARLTSHSFAPLPDFPDDEHTF